MTPGPPSVRHPLGGSRRAPRRTAESERGSLTLEIAVLAPGLLLLVGLLTVGGRIAVAHTAVQSAASDAARSASLARSAPRAQSDAESVARDALQAKGLHCTSSDVVVDVAGFSIPVGQRAAVTVRVSCGVTLSDLPMPGLSGDRDVQASATSPLDTYRER